MQETRNTHAKRASRTHALPTGGLRLAGSARVTHHKISNLQSAIRNQAGQAIVMVLLALTLAVLLVTGFLYFASTSQRATQAAREQTSGRYSADAGAEHATWRLTNEAGFAPAPGSSVVYTITINGQTVVITVTRALTP